MELGARVTRVWAGEPCGHWWCWSLLLFRRELNMPLYNMLLVRALTHD